MEGGVKGRWGGRTDAKQYDTVCTVLATTSHLASKRPSRLLGVHVSSERFIKRNHTMKQGTEGRKKGKNSGSYPPELLGCIVRPLSKPNLMHQTWR